MKKEIRILMLEDVACDVVMINHELREAGLSFRSQRIETKAEFLHQLEHEPPDLILSDHGLPSFDGFSALAVAKDKCPDVPFIFVTSALGEEFTIKTFESGATDYVLKGQLFNLVPAVRRALREAEERRQRKQMEAALAESEGRFRMLVDGIKDYAICMLDRESCITSWNSGAEWMKGYRAAEILGEHYSRFFTPEDQAVRRPEAMLRTAAAEGRHEEECSLVGKSGDRFRAHVVLTALRDATGTLRGFAEVTRRIADRTSGEEALQRSEARKSAILAAALDAILYIDYRGAIYEWNRAAERIFGYHAAEVLGRRIDDLIVSPSLRGAYPDGLADYLGNGIGSLLGRPVELTLMRADRSEFQAEFGVTRIPNEEPPCFTVVIRDITERKAAEEALRESEERFRLLVESVEKYAIYSVDTEGRVTFWNTGAERLMGYGEAEILGQPVARFYTAEDCEQHKPEQVLREAAARGRAEEETWRVRKDGSRFRAHSLTTPLRDETGQLRGFSRISRDVTARRESEDKLRRSEELYRTLAGSIPGGGAVIFDRDLRHLVVAGEEVLRAHSLSREALEGKTLAEVFPPELCARIEPVYRAALDGTRTVLEVASNNRTYFVQAVPLKNGNSHIYAGLVVGLDITERKQAEERVRTLNAELSQRVQERTAELEAANRELDAFNHSVSHDLRTPLRHIEGFVRQFRKSAPRLGAESRRHLETIANSALTMGKLIDGLLTLSRVGRAELRRIEIDLAELVRAARQDLHREVEGRKVEWVIHPMPVVRGDPVLLRQVLVNLISNALKYTRTREAARIEIGAQESGDEVTFFIRDNGVGFDMRYGEKLFGVFQRLHPGDQFEGIGIGLANVQRIIQRHGGRTWAEGAPDRGATFYWSLPKEREASNGQKETDPDSR